MVYVAQMQNVKSSVTHPIVPVWLDLSVIHSFVVKRNWNCQWLRDLRPVFLLLVVLMQSAGKRIVQVPVFVCQIISEILMKVVGLNVHSILTVHLTKHVLEINVKILVQVYVDKMQNAK